MVTIRRATTENADELSQLAFESKKYWGYPDEWLQTWAQQLRIEPEYIAQYPRT